MSSRVGHFSLIRPLVTGPLGETWLAVGDDGAEVALKRSVDRAPTDEFRVLAELDHPGVPRVAACGVDAGRFWMATDWIPGEPLEEGLAAGVDEESFAAAVAHTLLYLGSCGLVHGDVHPGNLMVARAGFPGRLLDFGLAAEGSGLPAGRRGFIAPEVLRGGFRTPASDLYGLGASLRDRGAACTPVVEPFARELTSSDPEVRLAAAREFAASRARPACGPRKRCRGRELAAIVGRIEFGSRAGGAILLHGEPGMGKSSLLERACLEARARGWAVERGGRGGADEMATRWAGGSRPLLVAVENLEGHARSVVEAVKRLEAAGVIGVLVVATASGPVEGWPWEAVELGRLEAPEVGGIFRQVSGVDGIAEVDLRRVAEMSGGNPRHAVSIARAVVAGGGIEHRVGGWNLRPLGAIAVPADAAAAARPVVGRLAPRERRMLAAAALAGGAVSRAALPVAADGSVAEVERLEAEGLLRPEGVAVVPRDGALGNAAIEMLDLSARSQLHRKLAALTAEAGAPRWVSAWHWVRSGDPGAAGREALSAGRELDAVGDLNGARELFAAGIAVAGGASRERLEGALVALDSSERADAAIARRAEELALSASDRDVRMSMGAIAIAQWHRLRKWDEIDAAAKRLAPGLGAWVSDRAAMARAIRAASQGAPIEASVALKECASSDEAHLIAWQRSCRGDFRGAARAFVRAVALALKIGSRRKAGGCLEGAVTCLLALGHCGRASKLLRAANSRLPFSFQSLPELHSAQSQILAAQGRVGRALAALREFERGSVLCGRSKDERARARVFQGTLLRFAGRPAEALACLASAGQDLPARSQAWTALPNCLALMDVGKFEQARLAAADGARVYREFGDESGAAYLSAVRALASRELGHSSWVAEARALPAIVKGDGCAEACCALALGEAAIVAGDREAAAPHFERVRAFASRHRLLGCELAARASVTCSLSGEEKLARALADAVDPVPDSPIIEVWTAVARACLESRAVAALAHLEAVQGLLSSCGECARRAWLKAAAEAARKTGRDQEAASWSRQHESSKRGKREGAVESRGLAAQARFIKDIVQDINAERSVARLLDKILDASIAIAGAERGCLVLLEGGGPVVKARRPDGSGLGATDEFSRTISDRVMSSGEPFYTGAAMDDPRVAGSASIPRLRVHSALCTPFRLKGKLLGTLYLDHRRKVDAFDPSSLDALQTLSDLAAVAIENARLFEENERQKAQLEERAKRLEQRLEEVERRDGQDAEAGLKGKYPAIVGRGHAMMKLLRAVDRAAHHTLPALIHGETGAGKELVAHAIHENGPFRKGPFIAENCAAISPLLMESELFGHVKGAFTGASADHEGLFRRANGGVLLLDEIGELDPALQAKLLRVLEDGVVRPVGSDKAYKVRVRVLGATHRDLEAQVEAGGFRKDLYYRLSSFRIEVPGLKEHREDIPELVHRILGRAGGDVAVDDAAMELLMACEWPGNVRQLEQRILVLAAPGIERVTPAQVQEVLWRDMPRASALGEKLGEAIEKFRVARVRETIVACGGKLSVAAKRLGMTYQGVRKIAMKHNLLPLKDLAPSMNAGSKRPRKRTGHK